MTCPTFRSIGATPNTFGRVRLLSRRCGVLDLSGMKQHTQALRTRFVARHTTAVCGCELQKVMVIMHLNWYHWQIDSDYPIVIT